MIFTPSITYKTKTPSNLHAISISNFQTKKSLTKFQTETSHKLQFNHIRRLFFRRPNILKQFPKHIFLLHATTHSKLHRFHFKICIIPESKELLILNWESFFIRCWLINWNFNFWTLLKSFLIALLGNFHGGFAIPTHSESFSVINSRIC